MYAARARRRRALGVRARPLVITCGLVRVACYRLRMRTGTLTLVCALAITTIPLAGAFIASDARASVSLAITWDGLLRDSIAAAIVTSVDSRSVWEDGRIYTYTRVRVDLPVAGDLGAGAERWVRTMGGVVGRVGQLVEGEAVLAPGEPSLLFVRPGPVASLEVTGRGQGQFPVVPADGNVAAHVVRSHAVGMLVMPPSVGTVGAPAPPRLAADVLHGRLVDEVEHAVVADWSRAHAR
jgi:hypothetical protein